MENKVNMIEPLLERVEQYSKTSFELLKLRSINKMADLCSTLISRILLTIVISLFIITLNIAASLWLGEVTGKNYYGFLLVASFYFVIGIILIIIHPFIKTKMNNSILTQLLN